MSKGNTYITFGQSHRHDIGGTIFDKDCVAVIENVEPKDGRAMAFRLFGPKFCFEYHDDYKSQPDMSYFPRGYIVVDKNIIPKE